MAECSRRHLCCQVSWRPIRGHNFVTFVNRATERTPIVLRDDVQCYLRFFWPELRLRKTRQLCRCWP